MTDHDSGTQAERQDLFRYVVEEFAEDYHEGEFNRRELLRRLGLLAGGVAGATVLLESLGLNKASAAEWKQAFASIPPKEPAAPSTTAPSPKVEPSDPEISAEMISYTARGFKHFAYLAHPAHAKDAPLKDAPGILVIHENKGLQPHIQDVARRLAKAGYVALAPDLVSQAGGTPKFTDLAEISSLLAKTTGDEHIANLLEALKVLKASKGVTPNRLGVVGFCFGGGLTWRLATAAGELSAAVPFYGPSPDLANVPNIKAAMLGIYGGNDTRINGGIPALEEALKKAKTKYQVKIYPGVNHAFHNDTGANYNADAAKDAWAKTLEWFKLYV
jgi:carboxymethylenebutenolidase